ncbi:7844_t:CDS:2, partial [Acaulospora morrowiae]
MLGLQHPSVIRENRSNSSNRSHIINSLIEESCRDSRYPQDALRWIPFESFKSIQYFTKGEFAEIALAFHRRNECNQIHDYEKKEIPDDIALRFIKNSRMVDEKLVNELRLLHHKQIRTHHKCMMHSQNVIPLYGLTQDPRTLDYALVLKHARHGDLRNFLRRSLTWSEKLSMLIKIAKTLKEIHELNLVHRDFHCKNILVDDNDFPSNSYELFVSDFGLCMDVSSSKIDLNVIEGVLPYIAPEILV